MRDCQHTGREVAKILRLGSRQHCQEHRYSCTVLSTHSPRQTGFDRRMQVSGGGHDDVVHERPQHLQAIFVEIWSIVVDSRKVRE